MAARDRILRELRECGLLLVTDPVLQSAVGLVTGESVRGSWWAHPKAHEIYAILETLEDDEQALLVKLVSNKQTLVHCSLWPADAQRLRRRGGETVHLRARSRDPVGRECRVRSPRARPGEKDVLELDNQGMKRPSRVEFELIPKQEGTEVAFKHQGEADEPVTGGLTGGWPDMLERLTSTLRNGRSRRQKGEQS